MREAVRSAVQPGYTPTDAHGGDAVPVRGMRDGVRVFEFVFGAHADEAREGYSDRAEEGGGGFEAAGEEVSEG